MPSQQVQEKIMMIGRNVNIIGYNRIESPEINPQKYSQLIFDKRERAILWRKNSLFNK